MLLILTNSDDKTKIVVNSDTVKIWEKNPKNPLVTDVVFGVDLVRVVDESLESISFALNPVTPR